MGVVDMLLRERTRVAEPRSYAGMTPLFLSSKNGHRLVVRSLLVASADVEAETHLGWRPIHAAAAAGHLEVVTMLVGSGADVDSVNRRGKTALYRATRCGFLAIVDFLLEHGSDPNAKTTNNRSTLLGRNGRRGVEAPWCCSPDSLAHTPCPCDRSAPAFVAAQEGHTAVLARLIRAGANLTIRTSNNETPLHVAISTRNIDVVAAVAFGLGRRQTAGSGGGDTLDGGGVRGGQGGDADSPLHDASLDAYLALFLGDDPERSLFEALLARGRVVRLEDTDPQFRAAFAPPLRVMSPGATEDAIAGGGAVGGGGGDGGAGVDPAAVAALLAGAALSSREFEKETSVAYAAIVRGECVCVSVCEVRLSVCL